MGIDAIILLGFILCILSLIFSCVWNIVYIITFLTLSSIWIIIFGIIFTMINVPTMTQLINNDEDLLILVILFSMLFTMSSILRCMQNSRKNQ